MAALAISRGMNIVFLYQLFTKLYLVWNFIAHGGNLFNRANVFFRRAVAIEAPAHTKWFGLVHYIHFVDAAVAALTTNAHIYVRRVVEVSIVGQVVNPNPFN